MAKTPIILPIGSERGFLATLNEDLQNIKKAFENTLSRDGSTPNHMDADLDMNSNDILNATDIHTKELYLNGTPIKQAIPDLEDIIELVEEARTAAEALQSAAYGRESYFVIVPGTSWYPITFDPGVDSAIDVFVNGLKMRESIDFIRENVGGLPGIRFLNEDFMKQHANYTVQYKTIKELVSTNTTDDPKTFLSRADLVSYIASHTVDAGSQFWAEGLGYLFPPVGHKDFGASPIPDLPGLIPQGDARFRHWGAVGDGVADDTKALKKALEFCLDGRTLLGEGGKTYKVTETLIPSGTVGSLDVDLYGGTILVDADVPLINIAGNVFGRFNLSTDYAGGTTISLASNLPRTMTDGDIGVILSNALDPYNRGLSSGASQYRISERFVCAPGSDLNSITLRRPLKYTKGVLEGTTPTSETDWVDSYTTTNKATVWIYDRTSKFRFVGGYLKYGATAESNSSGITVARYVNPEVDIEVLGSQETGISLSGCYGAEVDIRASGKGTNHVITVTSGASRLKLNSLGHGYGQTDSTESTIADVSTATAVNAFAAGRHGPVLVSDGIIVGGGSNAHYDTHSGASDWVFNNCYSEGAIQWAAQFRGQNIRHSGLRAVNAYQGVTFLTENSGGLYNNGKTPSSLTYGVLDGGEIDCYQSPLVVNASRAELRGDIKVASRDERALYVSGSVAEVFGSINITLKPGVNRTNTGLIDVVPNQKDAYNLDFSKLIVHPGASITIDAREITTSVIGIRCLTGGRVENRGTITLLMPAGGGNLIAGSVVCQGDGVIYYSYEGEAGTDRDPVGTRTNLRVKSLDGTYCRDDLSTIQTQGEFGTRFALAASNTPVANSSFGFELVSDTVLRVKVKGADGVVRSSDISLT